MSNYTYGGCSFDSERECAVAEFYDFVTAGGINGHEDSLDSIHNGDAVREYLYAVESGDWSPSVPMLPESVKAVAEEVASILNEEILSAEEE